MIKQFNLQGIMRRRFHFFVGLGFVLFMLMLSACENDLKKVQQISAKDVNTPVDRTTGVDVIYSDSARVKAHMQTPLLLNYATAQPYREMPKGVKVVFYDKDLHTTSTITSEYAVTRNDNKIIELRKNVVATNNKGETFKSDELIWNEATRKVTSSKPVHITLSNGGYFNASGLETNEQFSPWSMPNTTGKLPVNQNVTQP
ncbi:LPS export ABC transporter periplasmic protein LptC [Mucilaginibacter robiniae]|uniref:LPS export ABC transporter periplasmic protein LptC n=1 Tax=Mucilaginibacter robiniae TaxID=2728022 RepID=A0A7L5DX58_9SPHI|nr:LPS export ABC transporter periplasmic protein LptC [Mucilaginibacter robiniae]QJD95682.1 LPS export ABC transporter periplasmic protein LptC [Mucilaginibacter robiniae]